MNYWLLKTEPGCFSIQDLAACPRRTTGWDGVRNYQARNFMRDQMRQGDRVLVYHSSADPPVVAGTARVVREAYPDTTALIHKINITTLKRRPKIPFGIALIFSSNRFFASRWCSRRCAACPPSTQWNCCVKDRVCRSSRCAHRV